MSMDLIRYAHLLAEEVDPASNFPTADEIVSILKRHLNKREALGDLHELRNRLLAGARRLLVNTVRLNRIVDEPNFQQIMANLSGVNRVKGYWASRLLSIPLLKSAIDQLSKAETAPQIALGISRLTGIVEDQEMPVSGPYKPRIQGGEPSYHQVYKYLTKIAGWSPERLQEIDQTMATLRDSLVKQITSRAAQGRKLRLPRPAGW